MSFFFFKCRFNFCSYSPVLLFSILFTTASLHELKGDFLLEIQKYINRNCKRANYFFHFPPIKNVIIKDNQ